MDFVCSGGSIYTVHDEVKDKAFILDLSWIGECQLHSRFFLRLVVSLIS